MKINFNPIVPTMAATAFAALFSLSVNATTVGSAQVDDMMNINMETWQTGDSTFTMTQDSLIIGPNYSGIPNTAGVSISQDANNDMGIFTGYTEGLMGSVISFSDDNMTNPFLDLGNDAETSHFIFGDDDAIVTNPLHQSFSDGMDAFFATAADYVVQDVLVNGVANGTSSIIVGLTGDWVIGGPNPGTYNGSLSITLQTSGLASAIEASLASGDSLSGLQWSGITMAATQPPVPSPEPSTVALLGLGLVGLVLGRRRTS